jgi:hypothetical protein
MVKEVEKLADSEDMVSATNRAKYLLNEWKTIRVPSHLADRNVAERFRAACDKIFELSYLFKVIARKYPTFNFLSDKQKDLTKYREMENIVKRARTDLEDLIYSYDGQSQGYEMDQRACFASGLPKIETNFDNKLQSAWRPKAVYSYIPSNFLEPDFVVDITDFMDKKMEAILAFKSQFFNADTDEPNTFISDKSFLDMIKSQNLIFGKAIGVQYAEGFHTARYMGVDNLFDLI